ncbi:MAG: hypothetical protein IPI60_13730 [Saprospiraceae bacterium]|nr:hypothetical protein [Saprospiraceae bacterium]
MKSYKAETLDHIASNQQFKNQFKAYLATAIDMNGFQYIFNGRKEVNFNMVKLKFRELFQQGNYGIYNEINNANASLFRNLGIDDIEDFAEKVDNLDIELYKFIHLAN